MLPAHGESRQRAARLLLCGEAQSTRRLRMSMKVIAELRRRSWPFTAVVCGELPEELLRLEPPDEIHYRLSPSELLNLFRSSSVLLETTDRPSTASPAFAVAAALGIPIVSHFDGGENSPTVTVGEWSADAFADVVIGGDYAPGPSRDRAEVDAVIRKMSTVLE